VAVFADRFLALLTAAALPGIGRDSLLFLAGDPDPDGAGYAVRLDDGTGVGHLMQFEEDLIDSLNGLVSIVRSPGSLAYQLEAAGALPWNAAAQSSRSGSPRRRPRPVRRALSVEVGPALRRAVAQGLTSPARGQWYLGTPLRRPAMTAGRSAVTAAAAALAASASMC
jgi:hypothetical protein